MDTEALKTVAPKLYGLLRVAHSIDKVGARTTATVEIDDLFAAGREAATLNAKLNISNMLNAADVVRGHICRLVCFGVGDEDLPKVLDYCRTLEQESLERAGKELAALTGERVRAHADGG